jgi:hypothetical protein
MSTVSPCHILFNSIMAIFPFPAGMPLTKLFLGGNDLIIPGQGELVSDILHGCEQENR